MDKECAARTLLSQVLAVNTGLVAATAIVAALLAAPSSPQEVASGQRLLLISLAVVSAVLLNSLLLRRRLEPLDRLLATMERVDLASPGQRACAPPNAPREIERLTADFNRMLQRLEQERVDSGRAVIRAQEEERARIAQDLHDEVNQALTAILLRLQAAMLDVPPGLRSELKEIQTLATRAMEELLTLARTLRPTALDDHGLVPALASQVADFGERTGIKSSFHRHGEAPDPVRRGAARALPRHAGEPLQRRPAFRRQRRSRRALVDRAHRVARARRRLWLQAERGRPQPPRRLRHARARTAGRRAPERLLRTRRGHHHRTHHGSDMRILIADDHGIVRGGMKLLIDRQPDMEVVAEAGDGVEAFEQALATKPDLCVMDVSMPRMTGLQAARQIRAHLPETQVLALSMHDDERYVFDALKAGASGYVLKREVDQALLNAIRAVSRGEAFLTSAVERTIVREWMNDSSSGPEEPLSPREQEVLKLIAEAFTNKQIAETLHLAEKTVESHRANLLRKLGMRDRVELVRYAIRRGLTEA